MHACRKLYEIVPKSGEGEDVNHVMDDISVCVCDPEAPWCLDWTDNKTSSNQELPLSYND